MTFGKLPFGLNNAYIYPLDGSDAPGTGIPLPAGRTVDANPKESINTLTGYNGTVASNVSATTADITLDHGGIDLAVLAALTGGTIVTSGTTPNSKRVLDVGQAGLNRPYVMVAGQALADDGGDTIIKLWKVKFELPSGSFKESAYYIASMKGSAVRNTNGKLMSFIQNETPAILGVVAPV